MQLDLRSRQRPHRPEKKNQSNTHTFACVPFFFIHKDPKHTCHTDTQTLTGALWLSLDVLTVLGPDTMRKQVQGANTNKIRRKKLAFLLHCATPPQTPQFSHYNPLQRPSKDKRVSPPQVIGNQLGTLLSTVPHRYHRLRTWATFKPHRQQQKENIEVFLQCCELKAVVLQVKAATQRQDTTVFLFRAYI